MADGQCHSLARIPLQWMIRECFKAEAGIIFDAHMLEHRVGLNVDSINEAPEVLLPTDIDSAELNLHSSLKVVSPPEGVTFLGEAQEELHDAQSPIYDQLEKHMYWKVME